MAIKLKASCPKDATEAKKIEIYNDILSLTGIKVPLNEIKYNKGLREMAKLFLNSLWGKFGQRDEYTKTVYTDETTYSQYIKRVFDHKLEIHINQIHRTRSCYNAI